MGIWKMIFKPNDGTLREVKLAVAASQHERNIATSRFEDTIKELLETNDKITGRRNEDFRSQSG